MHNCTSREVSREVLREVSHCSQFVPFHPQHTHELYPPPTLYPPHTHTQKHIQVSAVQDWHKNRQFAKLNKQNNAIDIKVIRDGHEQVIPNTHVLVGDVLLLEAGDKVVADGVYVHGYDLVIDESSLTGESDPMKKHEGEPWCRRYGCVIGWGVAFGCGIGCGIGCGGCMGMRVTENQAQPKPFLVTPCPFPHTCTCNHKHPHSPTTPTHPHPHTHVQWHECYRRQRQGVGTRSRP